MNNLQLFLVTFIELSSTMVLFVTINKISSPRFVKSLAIILITTCTVIITSEMSSWLTTIINFSVFFLSIVLLFKKTIKEIFIKTLAIFISVVFVEVLLNSLIIALNLPTIFNKDFTNIMIANLIIFALCTWVYLFLNNRTLIQGNIKKISKVNFLVLSLLLYIFLVKLIWEKNKEIILENLIVTTVIPMVICIVNLLFSIYKDKIGKYERSIEIYNKYNPIIIDLIDEIRRRQHEFKNHLTTIHGVILTCEEEILRSELKGYLESLQDSLIKVDEHIQIKNRILNAIIYIKSNEAENKNIKFQYFSDDETIEFPLKDYELSEVINNLIDNSFEAVNKENVVEKSVYLKISQSENVKYIEVGNTGERITSEAIASIFKKGFTTKKKDGHGYGLYNVKKTVQNSKGKIELSHENNFTIFKIIFIN